MKKIRIISLFIILLFSTTTVGASVLGPNLVDSYTISIGEGTTSTHNTWYSDQEGVGQQTENYVTYKPNEFVEPIITYGEYLYGTSTISNEVSRIRNLGINSLAGINADFFSLETGIPMSNMISDGKIITKSDGVQYGIGILEDNTAFMSKIIMYSTLYKSDGTAISINHINKLRQPYAVYMMTDDFGTQTYNKTKGFDVILTEIEGEIKIGGEIEATIESVNEYEGSIAIPENKIVITVDSNAPEEYVNSISSLQAGEKIKITFGYEGDERWENVKAGIGATGEILIEDGILNSGFTAGAHPRTALGIKADGSIIFYTIDGRQKGYSYGVQLKSLAKRMEELGCVDAINLDGGGSTSYVIQFPGDSVTSVVNSPSDGKLRGVSNFLFLKNNKKATGILNQITVYPLTSYVLVGNSVTLTAKGSDTAAYPVNIDNLLYSVDDNVQSTVTDNGIFTAGNDGKVTVYAKSGSITGATDIVCVAKPDIIVKNSNGTQIDSITINRNEAIKLTGEAYFNYNKVVTSLSDSFKWSCDELIGTIDQNDNFTATDSVSDVNGNIYVQAGETVKAINVNVIGLTEVYNEIDISVDEDKLTVDFNLLTGLEISEDNITIKADGKLINFDYENGIAAAQINDSISKITVFCTNSKGYSSFASKLISYNKYDNPFTDTDNHWAEEYLSYMYSAGIVNGENSKDGLIFNPGKSMTRSEFAVMITNYLGIDTSEYADVELPYEDADKIAGWSLNSFKALYKSGIIQGSYADDKLYVYPLDNITRAEATTIIYRTLPTGLKKAEITSTDKNDIAEWSRDGFEALIQLGAINGYEDGTILPKKNVTKAEAAKILYTII